MVEPQTTRFWHAAVQSGLLDERALDACWSKISPEKRTADAIDRRLARKAVEMGWMTIWQAQQLLAGLRPQALRYDKYLLLDLIGQGGMGRVYLAKDVRLNRRVALKVLSRERMNNPRALARFLREAKVGAQLQHENLVRIYDEGEAHGNRYLVMEYIEGKTVGRLLLDHGAMPPAIAARIGRQISLGLDHLYQKGLLHRDVNPLNILVDRSGAAKLTDLGLAIDLGEPEDVVTRDGATVGTFDYISPEQAKHSRLVDIRSDIYSLGCTLYHMIAGRVPFPQPSLPEKLYAHQLVAPEPLSSIVTGVPPGLDAVIRRMMSKAPEERYPTPAAVAQALEPFQCGPAPLAEIEEAPALARLDPASSGLVRAIAATPESPSDGEAYSGAASSVAANLSPRGSGILPGIPQIDLGPEPKLSDSLSGTRTREGAGRGRLWLVLGGAVLFVAVIALIARMPWGQSSSSSQGAVDPRKKLGPITAQNAGAASAARPDIAVLWLDDGTETAEPTLLDAIRQAVGKRAEVILRNSKTLELKLERPLLISSGGVVIRAAEGAKPDLIVRLNPDTPMFRVSSDARLTLVGLRIQFGDSKGATKNAPLLIHCAGDLTLDRCAFSALEARREAQVAVAAGRSTSLSGCWFEGFDEPLSVQTFPNSRIRLRHCMFLGYKPGESPAGWAARVADVGLAYRGSRNDAGERRLSAERCTVIGAGLFELQGYTDPVPLHATVTDTVVKSSSLLMWGNAGPFPKGLKWSGKDDRYELAGVNWVVVGPKGIDGVRNGPVDFESWAAAVGAESGTKAVPVKLTSAAMDEPADLALVGEDAKTVGADPAFVGPGAKPIADEKP
jgi:serine/threonine protein kinase